MSVILTFLILILSVGLNSMAYSSSSISNKNIICQDKFQIDIPAGLDFYIKYDSDKQTLIKETLQPIVTGLNQDEINAIIKSPKWIQRKLVKQIQNMNNSDDYVNLILKSDLKYVDEIAFSIASSPLGNVPPVEVIEDNVRILYEIDRYLKYADIIDYDEGDGNYYSTVRYRVLENNNVQFFEYPKDIYYWYIVHPKINREITTHIYGSLWREYYFYHNDVGHYLINEQLNGTDYLWDGKSNSDNTVIQAIGEWVSNNIRYEIIGNRSGQPNIIAHEHTGYCGETQKMVAAAFRTALTPINGIMNYAEDHVWCEFFEREWYHIDGAVNNPSMYTDGWGQDMSSIWAWNGDGSIYEVTSRYLHPEDRIKVEFNVVDAYNKPVDGAIVTVLVKGLMDITWYKDYFSEIIDDIWGKIPEIFKIKILENMYELLKGKIDELDEVIEASQISVWNYTDINGKCQFELGKNDEYIFLVQKTDIRYPWPISLFNRIKKLSETKNITYKVRFNDFSNKKTSYNELSDITGNLNCNIKLNIDGYQLNRNIITGDIGTYNLPGKIDVYIVDEDNFELYKNGKKFSCYDFNEYDNADINFSLNEDDFYIIFKNNAQRTNVILDYEINIESSGDYDILKIVKPSTDILENPSYNIGTIINISGISTSISVEINIMNETEFVPTYNNKWFYQWDTNNKSPGEYLVKISNENKNDSLNIRLIDKTPPFVKIISPRDMEIFEEEIININGAASDNYKLNKIEIILDDNSPIILNATEEWNYNIDTKSLTYGEHLIKIKAHDYFGLTTIDEIKIIINRSESIFHPLINSLFIYPENPSNTSNIYLYSNVTAEGPFSIKKVMAYYDDGPGNISKEMFRHGDFPPQERHIEDNIQDIPNYPIYGIELGRFETGDIINCWVEAFDTANNKKISSFLTFEIQ